MANRCLRFYFRGLEINGQENIPTDGSPFIYAVNHQNAFIDAVIVGALSPIPTYFMTRSDVFKPPFAWWLDALKMMPIYRIRDGYSALSRNEEMFQRCQKIFEGQEAILIFPEGNHGLEYYLRPLTKGIARMAFSAQEKLESELKIIPVGLNYFDHFNCGHKLITNYGKPIEVKNYLSDYATHKHTALKQLTQEISKGMEPTLIIGTETEDYPNKKRVFQNRYEKLSSTELKKLLDTDATFDEVKENRFLLTISRIFDLPNFLPIWLCDWILKTKVSDKIFYSSIKFAVGMLLFPIWLLISFLLVTIIFCTKAAALLLMIQIVSMYLRRELRRVGRG